MEDQQNEVHYPVSVTVDYPETSSRKLALATLLLLIPKLIILIPHIVILYVFQFLVFIAWIVSQFAVLFVGRYPKGLHDLVTGFLRWQVRVNAYIFGLIDKYPPFHLK